MGPGLALYDAIYLTVATVLYGIALIAGAEAFSLLSRWLPWPFAVVPAVAVGLLALIAQVGVVSALLPRLRPGRYPLMKGKVFFGWLFRSLLRRVLFVPGVKWVVMSSNVLRFLALRAMGARVAFTANMSADVDLLDPALLEVGPGATIGARSFLSGHWVEGGKLVLGEIRIGARSLVAAEVMIAPGVVVGERAVVKARASLGPEVQVGERADIGATALLVARVVIEPGARVEAGQLVPAKARVTASESDAASRAQRDRS
jgi:acetyltransferase-like isoleucine patch superfamily enzyme